MYFAIPLQGFCRYWCRCICSPVYENLSYGPGAFPVAEQAAEEVLSLPIFPEMREDEVELVVKVLSDVT
jgi:dTDP-4-amino-4,6-dideoxygalactose transaminase